MNWYEVILVSERRSLWVSEFKILALPRRFSFNYIRYWGREIYRCWSDRGNKASKLPRTMERCVDLVSRPRPFRVRWEHRRQHRGWQAALPSVLSSQTATPVSSITRGKGRKIPLKLVQHLACIFPLPYLQDFAKQPWKYTKSCVRNKKSRKDQSPFFSLSFFFPCVI